MTAERATSSPIGALDRDLEERRASEVGERPERVLGGRGPLLSAVTVRGSTGFLALEHDWRAILDTIGTTNPFLCWEWVSQWTTHLCGDRLITVVVRDRGETVAIAPFHRRSYTLVPGLLSATCLQLFGPREDQHIFELREVLRRPGRDRQILDAMVGHLRATERWDWIELADYDGVALWDAARTCSPPGVTALSMGEDVVPVMPLAATWEEQRRGLGRNIKESIRRSYNSPRREGMAHQVRESRDHDSARECLDTFYALHRERAAMPGRRPHEDHFVSERRRAFLDGAVPLMMEAGHLSFSSITSGDRTVATRMCMEVNGSLYLYYSGFDPAWWRHSIMTLLVTERIKSAIDRGESSVNFSPGIDPSKARWGVSTRPLRRFLLVRNGWRPSLRLSLFRSMRSPRLRQLAWTLRALGSRARGRISGLGRAPGHGA